MPIYRWQTVTVTLLVLTYVFVFAFITRNYYMDDAYIGFTFLRHLILGQGFVFHPSQPPVEGVTNIGWLLLLTPLSFIISSPVAAKLLGLFLVLATFALMLRIAIILAESYVQKFPALLLLAAPIMLLLSTVDFLYFSLAGMETAFLSVILLLMTAIAARRPTSLFLPALGCLAFLTHPEAVLVLPFFLIFSIWNSAISYKKIITVSIVYIICIISITLVRYAYFHELIPNTFGSKPVTLISFCYNVYYTIIGNNLSIPFPASAIFILSPLIITGMQRARQCNPNVAAMLGSSMFTGFIFSTYALPDWTFLGRYFAPYLPATLLLLWFGMIDVLSRLSFSKHSSAWRLWIAVIMIATLVMAGVLRTYAKLNPDALSQYPGYVLASTTLVKPAHWIRDHLPENSIIATRRIGVLSYFSNNRVFDYRYGLTEREVAQLIGQRKHQFKNPNNPDLTMIWQRTQPDYLLEDDHVLKYIAKKSGGSLDSFTIHGITYHVVKRFTIGKNVQWVLARRKNSSRSSAASALIPNSAGA